MCEPQPEPGHVTSTDSGAYVSAATCTCGWAREFRGFRRDVKARAEADRHDVDVSGKWVQQLE